MGIKQCSFFLDRGPGQLTGSGGKTAPWRAPIHHSCVPGSRGALYNARN